MVVYEVVTSKVKLSLSTPLLKKRRDNPGVKKLFLTFISTFLLPVIFRPISRHRNKERDDVLHDRYGCTLKRFICRSLKLPSSVLLPLVTVLLLSDDHFRRKVSTITTPYVLVQGHVGSETVRVFETLRRTVVKESLCHFQSLITTIFHHRTTFRAEM